MESLSVIYGYGWPGWLLPTTRFARLTCLILGIDLLLFALKKVLDSSAVHTASL